MRLIKLILLGIFLGVGTTYAQDSTLRIKQIDEQLSPLVSLRDEFFVSPALRPYYREQSYSILAADYEHKKKDLFIRQDGNGNKGLNIHSESFLKKLDGISLWGKAYYINEKVTKVSYNETLDYHLIYPYVIADTVGGDLNAETYYFSGGLSKKIGGFTYGANASFKGIQSYRAVDPRPKNISSDINLSLSVAKSLSSKYAISLDINGQKYNQNNALEFVNALGFPLVFHSAGLGMYNELLAGKRLLAYYNGLQIGGQVNIASINRNGFSAQFGYHQFSFDKELSGIAAPISDVSHDIVHLIAGYAKTTEVNQYLFKIKASYAKRNGIEAKFGILDAGVSMVKISEDLRYGHERAQVGFNAVYGRKSKSIDWFLGLEATFVDDNEYYINPERFVTFQNLQFGATINASTMIKKKKVNLNVKALQLQVLSNDHLFSGQKTDTGIFSMLNQNFAYVSSNALTLSASLRVDHPISEKLNLFLKGTGAVTQYAQPFKENYFMISTGFLF